ncbi:hypothetical protein ES703_77488 [subsurface metagenome]
MSRNQSKHKNQILILKGCELRGRYFMGALRGANRKCQHDPFHEFRKPGVQPGHLDLRGIVQMVDREHT